MIAKLAIVEEETDETLYWLELLVDSDLVSATKPSARQNEINEILAMVVTSIKTLRSRTTRIKNIKSKIQNH
jgi:four helix bundle protein